MDNHYNLKCYFRVPIYFVVGPFTFLGLGLYLDVTWSGCQAFNVIV